MRVAWATPSDIYPVSRLLEEMGETEEVWELVPRIKFGAASYKKRSFEVNRIRGVTFPKDNSVYKALKMIEPEVVVSDEAYQPITSECARYCMDMCIPFVVTVRRNNTSGIMERLFFEIFRGKMVSNLIKADRVVSISSEGVLWLLDKLDICTAAMVESKIKYIPNGVGDPSKLACGECLRTELKIPKDAPMILNVSRNHPDKRLDLTLEAFRDVKARRKDARLVIVGEGTDKLPKEEGVTTVGEVEHHRIGNYYDAADVVMLTSRREPFGYSLIEGMSYGKPVVAFDVGGVKDIIVPGLNGLTVSFGNTSGMAIGILTAIKNRDSIGAYGKKKTSPGGEFHIGTVCGQWTHLLKEVVK